MFSRNTFIGANLLTSRPELLLFALLGFLFVLVAGSLKVGSTRVWEKHALFSSDAVDASVSAGLFFSLFNYD
jgi:hypothetical protein